MKITFKKEKISEIIRDFYTMTKMQIAVFDSNLEIVEAYPQLGCDLHECVENADCNNFYAVHKCEKGVDKTLLPLKLNGIPFGYILFCGVSEKAEEEIFAAAKIIERCICDLCVTKHDENAGADAAVYVESYINRNINSDLSVERICRELAISRSNLYRISAGAYGMGIANYIRKKRITLAKKYLDSGHTVSEAAEKSGFTDNNYFSKIFKKETGKLPSEYKKTV